MTMQTLSDQTLAEAHAMAAQSHTWMSGRSKATGQTFWVIPSRSEAGKAHWTTSFGCTCKGHRRRGICAHVEAVRIWEQEQARLDAEIDAAIAEALGEVPSLKSLRDLYPPCAGGCGQIIESNLLWCDDCSAARERAEKLAAARRRVMEEVTACRMSNSGVK